MKSTFSLLLLSSALMLCACSEQPQGASYVEGKGYGGKTDTKPYAGDTFKGNKAEWEKALAERSKKQNEYARMQQG